MESDNRREERDGSRDLTEILILLIWVVVAGGAGAVSNIAVYVIDNIFSVDIPVWVNVTAFVAGAGICLLGLHRLMNDSWVPFRRTRAQSPLRGKGDAHE